MKGPRLPYKLKWGDRTAARAGEADYPIGIGLAGCTNLKDVSIAEVHESVADEAGAWNMPEGLEGIDGGGRVEHTRRLGGYRRRRVYGEAARRGILQVYRT